MTITLKSARVSKGMTQADVAEKIGVAVNTISNWEQGKVKIPADTYLDLCKLYEVDANSVILRT